MSTENKWYDLSKLLSYNKMLNFVLSHRGGGKTYSCKKLAIKNFLKTGKQFVYLRRYKTELKGDNVAKWFDDVSVEFPDVVFEVKGHTFYINGEQAGFALALSQQVQIRSTPFPNVTLIIMDEFVLDDRSTNLKYLPDEVKTFLEVLSTIIRSRNDVRVICCANSISYVNPYFSYFGLFCDANTKREFILNKEKTVVLQLFKSEAFKKDMEQTEFGKLIKGTAYGNYAIDNEVFLDSPNFILKKRPKDSEFVMALKYKSKCYGIWRSNEEYIYHVSSSYDKNTKNFFTVTTEDHMYDIMSIKAIKRSPIIQELKMYYQQGLIFYSNQNIKKDTLAIFDSLGFNN